MPSVTAVSATLAVGGTVVGSWVGVGSTRACVGAMVAGAGDGAASAPHAKITAEAKTTTAEANAEGRFTDIFSLVPRIVPI